MLMCTLNFLCTCHLCLSDKLKLLYTNINVASFTIKVYIQECILRMQLLCSNNYVGKRTRKSILPATCVIYINYIFVWDFFTLNVSVGSLISSCSTGNQTYSCCIVVFFFEFLSYNTPVYICNDDHEHFFTMTYIYYFKNNISDEHSH